MNDSILPDVYERLIAMTTERFKHLWFQLVCCALFLISIYGGVFCQTAYKISGVVLDASNENPIPKVTIYLIGSGIKTVSDEQGRFSLDIYQDGSERLIFSHVGFDQKSLAIDSTIKTDRLRMFLEPKVIWQDEVVVSASLREQSLNKLSRSAAVVSDQKIADRMQSNMTDMLNSVPGFTQIWEYHSPLLLRGLNSKRLIVMMNGSRRIGTFPGGFFGQEMNIYDAQKVEVIKGPGSVIYGSGAVSGIVNVINRDPFGPRNTRAQLYSGYGSNNNEILEVARIYHQDTNYGFSFSGKFRKTRDMVYGNGETASNSDVEDRDLSFRAGFRISEKHMFTVTGKYHYGDWGKPRGFNGPTRHFTQVRNIEDRIHSALKYTFASGGIIETVSLSAFYDNGTRDYYKYRYNTVSGNLSALDLVHYKDRYGGGQVFTTLNLTDKRKMTLGLDGYIFRLDDPTDVVDYYNNTQGTLPGREGAGQQDLGAFINDEWELSKKFCTILGIRFDVTQVNEGQFSGRDERTERRTAFSGNLGLVYSPSEYTNLSLNLGRAFRMPVAEELFTEVISCKGIKKGNPDLQPEYSWNTDLGLRGTALEDRLRYDIALFYNRVDGYINETAANEIEDVDFTYKNTDAVVTGGELSVSYRFDNVFKKSNTLFASIGIAYTYGIDLYASGNNAPLFGIPPLSTSGELKYNGSLNRNWITGYSFSFQFEHAASQDRVAPVPEGSDAGPWGYEPSEQHLVFNIGLGLDSHSIPGKPGLRIVARNIFDKEYYPFGSYIPAMGVNIKTILSLRL
jgi:outer membrane receptor protein involved in Fe transport